MSRASVALVALSLLVVGSAEARPSRERRPPAAAPSPPPAEAPPAEAPPAEAEPAEPEVPFVAGPKLVDLGDGVEIDLPADYVLLERTEARALLEEGGDSATGVLAVVGRRDSDWQVVVSLDPIGHVSDADAGQLDADELLASLTRGTVEQNKVREAKGAPALFVDRWSQPPSYDRVRRILSWGIHLHSKEGPLLNVFTNVLGRSGYVGLNLITDPAQLDQATVEAAPILQAVRWQAGSRYDDFDPARDHDSGMGLRNLVVGGTAVAVASKLGLFAKLFLALKKGAVLLVAAFVGLGRWIKRKLGGRAGDQA